MPSSLVALPLPSAATPRVHSARARVAAALFGTALALSACSSDEVPSEDDPAESPTGLRTGIPAEWSAGIEDGLERYPDIGSVGMSAFDWDCPIVDSIDADGRTMKDGDATFWKLDDGVHELECGFYPPTPVSLLYAEAEDEAAFAGLEAATGAFEQRGNEQVEGEVTVGERTFVTVTFEYPTNPSAGTSYLACYLDPEALTRACLDVSHSDERSKDYDAEQAAEDLDGILSAEG